MCVVPNHRGLFGRAIPLSVAVGFLAIFASTAAFGSVQPSPQGIAESASTPARPAPSDVIDLLTTRSLIEDQATRQRLLMDYGWQFTTGDPEGAQQPDFDDSSWRTLDLPHDWSIEGPYDREATTSGRGGYLPTGTGWYRRTFSVPMPAGSGPGPRVQLEFDGIYQNSDVWVNGHHVGHRPYGYISFAYDVTPWLREGTNVVAVRVDNSKQPNSRWYSGSGIYRHVWMTVTAPLHIAHWGTAITTPVADSTAAVVSIRTEIENDHPVVMTGVLTSTIRDPRGVAIELIESTFRIEAGRATSIAQRLDVRSPALWSPETPSMYELEQVITIDDEAVDQVSTPFGIRSIAFDPDRGFLLNGQRVKMLGVNLHHDGGPVGAAVPEAVWIRRLHVLKEMGVNAIRTAHNPTAPEFMDLMDRMGFLVMDEAFDEWTHGKVEFGYHRYFEEWSERDLTDFIRRDRNHPSVVLWSLGNEIGEQHAPGGDAVLRRLKEIALREDPTRPVTTGNDHIAADDGAATPEFLGLLDVVGYNYVDRWHERRELYATQDRHDHPDWKMIGTENGSVRGMRGGYSLGDDPDRAEPNYTNGMLSAEQLWKFVSLNDWFAGDFMWTGIDYLGEAFWPRKSSTSGVVDLVGFPDDGFYFYQSRWTTAPMLHLLPHWNWPGREGQSIPVLAYTNVDAVELYLNDRFVGEKRIEFPRRGTSGCWNCYDGPRVFATTSDLHLSWDVPYEPGTLRAVGKRDGQTVVVEEVQTTGAPASIRLVADRDTLVSGIRDVAHVRVEVVDGQGRLVPTAENSVTFAVEGAGRLLAVGNGNPTDHSSYQASERTTFGGLALALVQTGHGTGPLTVTVSAPGIAPASVTLTVVPGTGPPTVPH